MLEPGYSLLSVQLMGELGWDFYRFYQRFYTIYESDPFSVQL